MKTRTTLFATTVIVASLAAAGTALAHPGGMGGPGYGMGMGPGMGPGMQQGFGPGMRHGGFGGMGSPAALATQLEQAKSALKITAAQEAAWTKYAGVMTQLAQVGNEMRTQMQKRMSEPKALSAEEMNAQRDAMSKLRVEHQAARATAYKDLFAVLTPEQRTIASQQLHGPRGDRMGSRGGRGGFGPGRGQCAG